MTSRSGQRIARYLCVFQTYQGLTIKGVFYDGPGAMGTIDARENKDLTEPVLVGNRDRMNEGIT